jgi:phenylalanyl-tRNA synthetase beta chain
LFELDLALLARLAVDAPRELKPIPRFPSLRRDLSLIVDEGVSAGEIIGEIRGIGIPIIEDAVVFDVFAGGTLEKGKKSVSVSLTLRSSEKTLTDEEANEVQSRVIASLKSSLGTELRKT